MTILIDVDKLEKDGVLPSAVAATLRRNAVAQTGSAAINMLLAFGAIAVAAGALALIPKGAFAVLMGLGFVGAGALICKAYERQWGKLGSVWMIVGALLLVGGESVLIDIPLPAALLAAMIMAWVGLLAHSKLLIALVPFAIAGAIGGSTGYWHACYMLDIEEPTVTIVVFSLLAFAAWKASAFLQGEKRGYAILFARVCVVLANFGFWIGSLWGDTPGHSWHGEQTAFFDTAARIIPASFFTDAWLVALIWAGVWGVRENRRFMVNTAAVFAAIHLYTQWFERFGLHPWAVIFAGIITIVFGLGLWHYNRAASGQENSMHIA